MVDQMRIFGAPGYYVQGRGAVDRAGPIAVPLGSRVLMVADRIVEEMIGERIGASVKEAGGTFLSVSFEGDVTHRNVDAMLETARPFGADVVVACGGGKGVDAGKAVCRELDARLITLPTAASNDGPTSRNFVYYGEAHELLSVEKLKRNPDAVIVDTEVIAKAPPILLVSGIGDALVKRFEAAQCIAAGGPNMFGGRATRTSAVLAVACDEVLRADAPAALEAAKRQEPDDAFERVIEACLLLAGLGFEGSGLSIAHAMTRGLSAVPASAAQLHGLVVGYALMVQFTLERRPDDFMEEQRRFYEKVGLPFSLAQLGVDASDRTAVETIATLTHRAPHTVNFERSLSAQDIAEAILHLEKRWA